MTSIFFVRHAQPDYTHINDATRPLTAQGKADVSAVTSFFANRSVDAVYSSPYKRSYDTVLPTAAALGKRVVTDRRFREREKGPGGSKKEMIRKRWADFSFREPGGESLFSVQKRNIRALGEILRLYRDKNVIVGTHGTALAVILNHYNHDFGCEDFWRIIDFMPYIIELQFEGERLLGVVEHLVMRKEYQPKKQARHPAIGRRVTVTVDRPMGSVHPKYSDMTYPINYGYVEGIMAADGEEQDVYLLGVEHPVMQFDAQVIAVIHRLDDVEDKWVAAPLGMQFSEEQIREKTRFTEQYYTIQIMM